jgi:capsid protein
VMTRGGDYHELIEQRAAELKEQQELGLVFDTNAELVNQKGDEQPPEHPEPPTDPPPDLPPA